MSTTTTIDLAAIAGAWRQRAEVCQRRLILCGGTGCVSSGAFVLRDRLQEALAAHDLDIRISLDLEDHPVHDAVHLSKSGCQGFCQMGPLLHIEPEGILYVKVRPEDAEEIAAALVEGRVIERLLYRDPHSGDVCPGPEQIGFYNQQTRVVLANCMIEPDDIGEYIARDGYRGAERAWTGLEPTEVCDIVGEAGLRGRGGGGFPTGRKWALTLKEPGPHKYVICNGDEGDPGAFMDRSVMEGNPHAVIEGMLIAARAIGGDYGYVYVRAEYPLAVQRMQRAVQDARRLGLLGPDVFGTGKPFDLHVMEGAGAFVCGEETALIASIEGQRGMPRPKPPFPAQRGLWDKPTVINNVETLASVPVILRDGGIAYRSRGTTG
ncbi:MAG: NADH-quinone oxidoreductase subunit F, partial [Planctomycetota bacterium]